MTPRVVMVHGWNGSPMNAWFPWLAHKLEQHGVQVLAPHMPLPRFPTIKRWVGQLQTVVGQCDARTYFIGHSLGCQAILRYLEQLPQGTQAGGAVFVGGFERVGISRLQMLQAFIAIGTWLRMPLAWDGIRHKACAYSALFSDDDGWVAQENARIFERQLQAHVRMLHGYGHFTSTEGVFELPEALESLLQMMHRTEQSIHTPDTPPARRERVSYGIIGLQH